jgi:hypothetical protein
MIRIQICPNITRPRNRRANSAISPLGDGHTRLQQQVVEVGSKGVRRLRSGDAVREKEEFAISGGSLLDEHVDDLVSVRRDLLVGCHVCTFRTDDALRVSLSDHQRRDASWKLHVGATSDPGTRGARHRAASPHPAPSSRQASDQHGRARRLSTRKCHRAHDGEVITVYPITVDDAYRMAPRNAQRGDEDRSKL